MRKDDFEMLKTSLEEAAVFIGGADVPGLRVHIPTEIDIRAIRARLGMTQAQFAERHGFSIGAVRDWEQGRRMPDQGTRAFLKVISAAPEVVESILQSA